MWNDQSYHHVKLVLVILDPEDHGHGLTDLDDSGHLAGVGALANLLKRWFICYYYL